MRRPFLVPSLIITLGSLALLHCSSSDNSPLAQDPGTAGTGGTGGSKAGSSSKGGSNSKGGSDAGKGGDDPGTSGAGGDDPGVEPTTEENTDEACSDFQDNDGDGHIDCDDFDCKKNGKVSVCESGPSMGAEVCGDGDDNDGNGFVDCADYACCKGDDAKTNCPDGCEQKGGGKAGAGGSSSGGTETCGNGKDDNGNGFSDCEDYACCKGDDAAKNCPGGCVEKGGTGSGKEICGNGKDDNGNGYADCEDFSCCKDGNPNAAKDCPNGCIGGSTGKGGGGGSGPDVPEEDNCTDGIDNDGNKFTDCKDFACCNPDRNPNAEKDCGKAALCPKTGGSGGGTATGPREDTEALCSDKMDNDGNGKADCDDFACSGFTACSNETTDEACKDGTDNDGDGKADCDDFSCLFAAGVTVCDLAAKEATDATCGDGVDNNGNKAIDCKDFACKSNPKVTVCK